MKIIHDVQKDAQAIKFCIKKYGHLPQHHYQAYLNYTKQDETNIFFNFGSGRGVLAYEKNAVWDILTDPISQQKEKKEILVQVIDWIFANRAKKIILDDISEELRKELIIIAKNKIWRLTRSNFVLTWPIVDLKNWDGGGRDWKRLRNFYNKFIRGYGFSIGGPGQASKAALKNLVFNWEKQHNDADPVYDLCYYLKFISANFDGCKLVRIIECGGDPISISAGWPVPNQSGIYYSGIGLYDYNYKNIGEVACWDEMVELKKLGFEKLNLGGGSGSLLNFKMKFHPSSFYKTYTFSIVKK